MGRLIYLSNARLPTEKANGVTSMQQCEALGESANVEFWHPRRRNNPLAVHGVFTYYGIRPTFRLRSFPCVDSRRLREWSARAGFLMQALSFQFVSGAGLVLQRGSLVVYSRNSLDVWFMPFVRAMRPRAGIFLEDHDGLLRRFAPVKRVLLRAVDGVVTISEAHANALVAAGFPRESILVAALAVDPARFPAASADPSQGGPVRVVYVGNLFPWKGVFTLVDALQHLPSHFSLTVVGGSPELAAAFDAYVAKLRLGSRITRIEPVPPTEVPTILAGASIVVLPNSAKSEKSATLTSPLKMFEYMAAGVPIVASNVPAIREVLEHGRNAWLVEPDSGQALAEGIQHLAAHPALRRELGRAARADAEVRTWAARADRMITFMESRSRVALRFAPANH